MVGNLSQKMIKGKIEHGSAIECFAFFGKVLKNGKHNKHNVCRLIKLNQ